MEATEALSVAATAVSFADFLIKVVKQISATRASIKGQPDRVVDLATCMAELSSIASTVQNGIKGLRSSYPQHADSINHLTRECFDIETRVKVVVDKLTVNRAGRLETALSTASVAFRSVWLEKELAELSDQLNGIRSRIQLYVLTYTLDEVKNTHNQTDEIREIVQSIEAAMDGRECDFERNGTGQVSYPSGQTHVNTKAIWALTGLVDFSTDPELPPLPAPPATNMAIKETKKSPFAQNICYTLYTAEMGNRESLVALAFPKTFQWLFNIPPGNQPGRGKDSGLRFRQWLGSQSKAVFWITGVPASGKSTLMRFITSHPSLKDQLRGWAGDDQLYIAKFYFWGPGSETQKSRVGLLRSLLHQLLTARPDLAEAVAPRRHLFFQLAGDGSMYPEWEWTELTQCMLRFVTLIRETGSRLALFIDGLDEYDGFLEENPATHKTTDEMMDFLISLSRDPGVKICVSSRPLNIFMDKFKLSPSLTMQDVTQPDINLYVDEQLGKSEAIRDLRRWGSKEMESVTRELKQKANGVFLWVVLMVEQLLLTSQDNPSIDAIRKVMRDLPKDLNTLYDRIQDKIGPRKGSDASRLYQLIMTWKRFWKGPMKATLLWLAFDKDIGQQEYPEPDREPDIAKFTKRLLAGHTRGLLQISDSSSSGNTHTVDFLHRTAYEWIQERSNWGRILDSGPADYEPVLPILAVLVSRTLYLGKAPNFEFQYCRLCQIFLLAGNVTDTPDARAKLVSIKLTTQATGNTLTGHLTPPY
ncbi:hypothetical protein SAMD00023353_3401240 [Rosellinia necatrix]|uniref:Nephrocystin 3-like N-terminal domain-containing protein n=1 Tax=Rosellinia necatrix TaxID=77044 RepID=A0A1W2TL72_ROSNE|nr:hypothetical protein SAMD00023353_3401240 [Rosellinia necatrix]